MRFISKMFSQLTTDELYEILKSRAEIFLIEQNIVCNDIDNTDRECLHCFFCDDGAVKAYLRAFQSHSDAVTIGRVLTLEHEKGLGRELILRSIEKIRKQFNAEKVYVYAQKNAVGFYEKMGFNKISDEYTVDGVIRVTMEKNV